MKKNIRSSSKAPARLRCRFSSLLILAIISTTDAARSQGQVYPSQEEAQKAYEWIHSRISNKIQSRSGWAIAKEDAEPLPRNLQGLGEVGLGKGWATLGIAVPQGQASGGLTLGNLSTQTDVKVRWPDGSIRFAILTAWVEKRGTYEIQAAEAVAADLLSASSGEASVHFEISDKEYVATAPVSGTDDRWLAGPQVIEWRALVTPKTVQGDPHPLLRVIFDVREFRDGVKIWDVTVENTLDSEVGNSVLYDVRIEIEGRDAFNQKEVEHWYLTRWRQRIAEGVEEAEVRTDFEPFVRTGAVPRYMKSIPNPNYSVGGPNFEILGRGANTYDKMTATGGRKELAPYPDMTAQFIVHSTQDLRRYCLINGDLAGSWPIHIREPDQRLISIDERPNFWLDARGEDTPKWDWVRGAIGPLRADSNHVPSWAYVPYLVTGDRYYADELAFWANIHLIGTWPKRRGFSDDNPDGSAGILGRTKSPRGFAWTLRNLVDAAAYLPDGDPRKAYFVEKVQNNLRWGDEYAKAFEVPPTGAFFTKPRGKDKRQIGVWQNSYLGWSIHHAQQQGFVGGDELLFRLAGFQTKLFTSDPDYPKAYGTPYYLTVRVGEEDNWQYLQTMKELFDRTYREPDGNTRIAKKMQTDYGGAARIMAMILASRSFESQRF